MRRGRQFFINILVHYWCRKLPYWYYMLLFRLMLRFLGNKTIVSLSELSLDMLLKYSCRSTKCLKMTVSWWLYFIKAKDNYYLKCILRCIDKHYTCIVRISELYFTNDICTRKLCKRYFTGRKQYTHRILIGHLANIP